MELARKRRFRIASLTVACTAFLLVVGFGANHYMRVEAIPSLLECAASNGVQAIVCDKAIHVRLSDAEEVAALNREAGIHFPAMLPDRSAAEKYIRLFLSHGVDVNAATSVPNRGTGLHLAASVARPQAVELLLVHGGDPSIPDRDGKLPIDHAREAKRAAQERPGDYQRVIQLLEAAR